MIQLLIFSFKVRLLLLKTALSLLVLMLFCCYPVYSFTETPGSMSETSDFDDSDDEFDEAENVSLVTTNSKKDKSKREFFSEFVFTFSHNYSYGIKKPDRETVTNRSSLRCEIDKALSDVFLLKFDGKSTLFFHNDHVAKAEQKDALTELTINQFYVQASFERLRFKAGKQIVVWGETDGGVINDIASPRDESEFIFTKIKDARRGQYMVSADYYSDIGNFLCFVTFKPDNNKTPETGSRYYTGPYGVTVSENQTEFSDNEAGIKWNKSYSNVDVSLMAGSFFQNRGVFRQTSASKLEKKYERYTFYGIGTSYPKGSFLYKLDASVKNNYSIQTIGSTSGFNRKKTDISDTAIGIEYDANGRYLLSLEFTNRYIKDYTNTMYGMERNNTGLYFLFNKKFLNETLIFQYILYHQFQQRAYFHETECEYSISDNLEICFNYHYFQVNDNKSPFRHYKNEDRVGVLMNYCF